MLCNMFEFEHSKTFYDYSNLICNPFHVYTCAKKVLVEEEKRGETRGGAYIFNLRGEDLFLGAGKKGVA